MSAPSSPHPLPSPSPLTLLQTIHPSPSRHTLSISPPPPPLTNRQLTQSLTHSLIHLLTTRSLTHQFIISHSLSLSGDSPGLKRAGTMVNTAAEGKELLVSPRCLLSLFSASQLIRVVVSHCQKGEKNIQGSRSATKKAQGLCFFSPLPFSQSRSFRLADSLSSLFLSF